MPEKIKVDFRKYNWIGSISQDLTVCYVWHAFGPRRSPSSRRGRSSTWA